MILRGYARRREHEVVELAQQAYLVSCWVWQASAGKLPPLSELLETLLGRSQAEQLDPEARTERDVSAWKQWSAARQAAAAAEAARKGP